MATAPAPSGGSNRTKQDRACGRRKRTSAAELPQPQRRHLQHEIFLIARPFRRPPRACRRASRTTLRLGSGDSARNASVARGFSTNGAGSATRMFQRRKQQPLSGCRCARSTNGTVAPAGNTLSRFMSCRSRFEDPVRLTNGGPVLPAPHRRLLRPHSAGSDRLGGSSPSMEGYRPVPTTRTGSLHDAGRCVPKARRTQCIAPTKPLARRRGRG